MKKWIVLILVLTVLVLAGCGTDGGKLDSVGGVNQDSVELTEEMEAMLQEMGISLEKFATYSPEQQQAILGELGIVAGDREEQSTRPTGEKYTTADVAAGGKYMVYIGDDGSILCDYLNPKQLLDTMRLACKGKTEPIKAICQKFNAETKDGRDMAEVSSLLSEAISSIIATKDESDIDSLFSAGGTTALLSTVSGWDDFELICFLVVKSEER
jgi:hypothetical protein